MNEVKVAIIGAGPAGIACAIQLKRSGIETIVLEKNQIGGLLRNANLVENYPGFGSGITGLELVAKFKESLDINGVSIIPARAEKISRIDNHFYIETDKVIFKSEILVVATGTTAKTVDIHSHIPQEKVFYEIAELNKIKTQALDKKFVVVGAGDAAFDYALNLVENFAAEKLVILNRGTKTKCLWALEEKVSKCEKIRCFNNIQINKIKDTENGLVVSCFNGTDNLDFYPDYILFAIGRNPCNEFLDKEIIDSSNDLEKEGLLYFIGDVANGLKRQTVIAVADGVKAAMKIQDSVK